MKTPRFLLAAGVSLALALTFSCSSDDGDDIAYGTLPHGDKSYKTVKIGEQTWMAENLNHAVEGSKCYGGDPANCAKYGQLYDWATATGQGICPDGWKLPSDDDWKELVTTVGGDDVAGTKLKAKKDWNSLNGVSGNGTDNYGFSALPGGSILSDGESKNIGYYGRWWSSNEYSPSNANSCGMGYADEKIDCDYVGKINLHYVRCVQEKSEP